MEALADLAVRFRFVDLGMKIFLRDQQTPEALGALQKARITGFLVTPGDDGAAPGGLATRANLESGRAAGAPTASLEPSVVFLALLRWCSFGRAPSEIILDLDATGRTIRHNLLDQPNHQADKRGAHESYGRFQYIETENSALGCRKCGSRHLNRPLWVKHHQHRRHRALSWDVGAPPPHGTSMCVVKSRVSAG